VPPSKLCRMRDNLLSGAIGIALCLNLAACNLAKTSQPTALPSSSITYMPLETATITPLPSPTTPPPVVILFAPAGVNAAQVGVLQPVVAELAAQDGLGFETRNLLADSDVTAEVRLVIVLPPDPGLANLATGHPATQFLAINIPGLQPSQNLNILGMQGDHPDQLGFAAGYLAAVITKDWRVGVISLGDAAGGRAARLAFNNGVVFYCGLCRPVYPPFYQYPLFAELPSGASIADQQAAADVMIKNAVKTVYVFPGAGDNTLLAYLAQAGINLIGGNTPPADVQGQWVATVHPDWIGAIRQIWPKLIRSQGGISQDASITLADINPNFLSPGRQRLVEQTLADLSAGFIDTGVNPLTGEVK
jgi:hypothetical protein